MPIRHALRPVGCLVEDPGRQVQELLVPRTVIKPINAGEIVAATLLLPERRQEVLVGDAEFPGKVLRHQADDTLIAGILVVRLERVQHGHVGPQVRLAGAVDARGFDISPRPEPSVLPLASDDPVDPHLGLGEHSRIAQYVGQVPIALQPIRRFLPELLAHTFRAEPGIVLFDQEPAQLRQMPEKTVGFQLKLFPQPALWLNRTDRQFDQWTRKQRLSIAHVEIVLPTALWPRNRVDCFCGLQRCRRRQQQGGENEVFDCVHARAPWLCRCRFIVKFQELTLKPGLTNVVLIPVLFFFSDSPPPQRPQLRPGRCICRPRH